MQASDSIKPGLEYIEKPIRIVFLAWHETQNGDEFRALAKTTGIYTPAKAKIRVPRR